MLIKFLAAIIVCSNSFAQSSDYETVVQDVIFNSSSKIVIDEKTIKESKAPDLISLITTQANVTLFNNNFQPPQLFLRGAESSHILILIDNVPVYDVSWAQRTLNLNSLDISNVKKIEIIKGGQTVLHGGQALAGVIKIETFSAQFKNEKKVMLSGALTQYTDNQVGISYEKQTGKKSGLVGSARLSKGTAQSPVLHSSKLYKQENQNLDLSYEELGDVTFRARGFYFKDNAFSPTTISGPTGQSIQDSDVERQDDQVGVSTQVTFNTMPMRPRIAFFGQKGWRFYYSKPTSANVDAKFRSQLQGMLLDLTLVEKAAVKVNTGLSYQKEDFFLDDSKATLSPAPRTADEFSELRGAYVMTQVVLAENYLFEAGARQEKASGFTEKGSYQLGLTLFKNTKFEWVTGYRAPSSAQIKGVFPNPNLEPETSQTYSLTQDVKLSNKGELSATLFETSFDNYIETRSIGAGILQYQNTAKVKTRGIEVTSSYILDEKRNLQMSYAYQEPWDQVRHQELRRRPKVSGSVRLFQNEKYSTWMLEGSGVGERHDFFSTFTYTFPGYFLVNAAVTYKLKENESVALRASNILDFRPEISIDYYGDGRNIWLSWEKTF